jgi:hypothetical protein
MKGHPKTKTEAGQNRPGTVAFSDPGTAAPQLHQRIYKSKTLCQTHRLCTACPQRVLYSRFFGASPVVSALDLRPRRDPGANGFTLRSPLQWSQAAR